MQVRKLAHAVKSKVWYPPNNKYRLFSLELARKSVYFLLAGKTDNFLAHKDAQLRQHTKRSPDKTSNSASNFVPSCNPSIKSST